MQQKHSHKIKLSRILYMLGFEKLWSLKTKPSSFWGLPLVSVHCSSDGCPPSFLPFPLCLSLPFPPLPSHSQEHSHSGIKVGRGEPQSQHQSFRDQTSHPGLTAISTSSHLLPAPSAKGLRGLLVPLFVPPDQYLLMKLKPSSFYSTDGHRRDKRGN